MIRLGRISYVNMAPVFYRVDAEVEEVQGVPTELNRMLVAGELDTAPISSIEYARHADSLRLLPRLCVASEGAVDSIQLVTRVPLERVRAVAVTPESATSVALTKVLLPEALPGIVAGFTITLVSLTGYSAMAGAIGGGGLGDLGIRYGYQRFLPEIMLAVVLVLIVFVQALQSLGDWAVRRLSHKQ